MKRKLSMLRTLLLVWLSVSAIEMWAYPSGEGRDTICQAKSAGELAVSYNPDYISITIKDLDDSGDNYYYKTGVSDIGKSDNMSVAIMRRLGEVTVVEVNGTKIEVSYKDRSGDLSYLTYEIPDPENRFVKSYIGWRGDDFGLSLGRKGRSRWSLISGGLGMGWVTPVNSSPGLTSSMGHSMEWSWLNVLGVSWRRGAHSLSAGIGIYWRNYAIRGGNYLEKVDGKIVMEPFSQGIEKGKSRLQTFSLQLPLLYSFHFGRHRNFSVCGGPIVNFNTGGNIKTQYREGDRDYTIVTHGISQTPVTIDAMASINWGIIGLYARYSPMNVLRKKSGLEFKSFSTGIMLMF